MVSAACRLGIRHANAASDWSGEEQVRALALAETSRPYRQIADDLAGAGFPKREHGAIGQVLRKLGYGRGWGRPWLPEEEALLRQAYERGDSLTPLQNRLGRSTCSIRWKADELGLRGTHVRPNGWRTEPDWTDDEILVLRRDYGRLSTPALAAALRRSKGGVFNKAHALGLVHGFMRAFTADEKAAIRIAHRTGISLTDLSRALDRDPAVVSKHAIRRLGLSFKNRPTKAPKTHLATRKPLSLAGILAAPVDVGGIPIPARQSIVAAVSRCPPDRAASDCTLIAGPGVPTMSPELLKAMVDAGLLRVTASIGSIGLVHAA